MCRESRSNDGFFFFTANIAPCANLLAYKIANAINKLTKLDVIYTKKFARPLSLSLSLQFNFPNGLLDTHFGWLNSEVLRYVLYTCVCCLVMYSNALISIFFTYLCLFNVHFRTQMERFNTLWHSDLVCAYAFKLTNKQSSNC